jgi:hypothetical protein
MKVRTALLPVVIALAGCGGDDGGDGGPSSEEYVAKADAICQAADTKQGAIKGESGGPYNNFSDAAYLSQHNAVTRDALQRLKALEASEDQQKEVDAFLAAVQGTVTAVDKQIAALRAKDLPAQSQATRDFQASYGDIGSTAGTVGLTSCQGLGN